MRLGNLSDDRVGSLRSALAPLVAVVLLAGVIVAGQAQDRPVAMNTPPEALPDDGLAGDISVSPTAFPVDATGRGAPLTGVAARPGGAGTAGITANSPTDAEEAPPTDGIDIVPAGSGTHGVTATEIEFGIWVYNSDQATAVVGGLSGDPSVPSGSEEDATKAAQGVVDHVNAAGGAAGRMVKPVYHTIDIARYVTPSGRQQEVQKACAAWTEDRQVFGFMELPYGQGLVCALPTQTVQVAGRDQGVAWLSDDMFREAHDLWYAPNWLLAARRERNVVESLWRSGYFTDARVGILTLDVPGVRAGVTTGMVPALGLHGIEPVIEILYPDSVESPWQNYILQLQSAGVTHVVMSATDGAWLAAVFAMRAADNQGFEPAWGIASGVSAY